MFITSKEQFLADSTNFKTVPVVSRYFADTLTPIQIFQQLESEATYLLESNDEQSPWSKFSFIGLTPFLYLTEEKGRYLVSTETEEIFAGESLKQSFEEAIRYVNVKPLEDLAIPFRGGAVGFVAYDAVEQFEPVLQKAGGSDQRKVHLIFCQTIIAYDHNKKELFVIELPRVTDDREKNEQIYFASVDRIEMLVQKMLTQEKQARLISPPNQTTEVDFAKVRSNYEKEKFLADVIKIKEYIRSGDVFQAVLSQRFEMDITVTGLDIYRVLRMINPSPYLFYIKMKDVEIVGSSPEKLVQIQDRHVEIHPIAGTRPRGKSKEEDERLAKDLLQDEKERAEHYMLVDLARNDIGRIATYGTVKTPVLLEIGKFSHVMHIISKVTGELREDVHPLDAFVSSFPAGTVSGAPKIRAMEILKEIEPTSRGIYAGAIGYFGYDGNIDSCIAIRTLVIKNNKAYVQAGAGIVADSVPENEYEETRNKAKALLKAIEVAEEMFGKAGENQYV